ncbi:serine hydrolase [Pedobacter sp. SYSU D00535]|uniref:serine hydrolase domain-containing protein n=1 Tax=Pedobacter sp. SYSU D00535 TaxID=2810308 RepID=UPI001A957D33|nr:serine hydrolase domain-containing protein [Pedobacter sp. SYSU D00535]
MKNLYLLPLILPLFCCFSTAYSQASIDDGKALKSTIHIDNLVKKEMDKQHIFGLSLAIVKNGKLLMAKGYGLADIENNISASEETVYKIGSVSKQMVAAAIMLLMQEGKLELSDSLPKFFKNAPESWNKITIRHLLNHTSGLPRDSPLLDNIKQQPDSVLIEGSYKSKLLFEPGTNWRYCNLGYFMLADIIRQLSRQSFEDFMHKEIFKKYNLYSTRTTSFAEIVKNRASGYIYKSSDSIYNAKDYLSLRPSGAFLSSVSDLVKWEMLIQNNQILHKKNWDTMWNDKVKTSNSNLGPYEYYGYGWDVNEYKNLRTVHHDGTLPGFTSSYFRFIDSKSAIIILTNTHNAYPKNIVLALADLIFNEESKKK